MGNLFDIVEPRRFWSNVIGYGIVLALFVFGPEMTGFLGRAVWAYVWIYPIYYIGTLIYRSQSNRGSE